MDRNEILIRNDHRNIQVYRKEKFTLLNLSSANTVLNMVL